MCGCRGVLFNIHTCKYCRFQKKFYINYFVFLYMTSLELRSEINKKIDNLPENKLPEVLNFLNTILQLSDDKEKLMQFIDKVFKEDDGLLRRLAQ